MINSLEPLIRITMQDYATPAFVTAEKYYFCTVAEYEEYCDMASTEGHDIYNENTEPAEGLWRRFSYAKPFESRHTNVWGYDYLLKAERAEYEHLWLRCCNKYYRCVKARLTNLSYYAETDGLPGIAFKYSFRPWGPPHIIELEGGVVYNRFYEVEAVFRTYVKASQDMQNFDDDPTLEAFFDDIFGDG